eukprot:8264-Eustigmatos_ZCMA.PRE.1
MADGTDDTIVLSYCCMRSLGQRTSCRACSTFSASGAVRVAGAVKTVGRPHNRAVVGVCCEKRT